MPGCSPISSAPVGARAAGGSRPATGPAGHRRARPGRRDRRILVTDDRDFGELVFRRRQRHVGVIYLRLGPDADLALKTERLGHVLAQHADQLDQFLVVTRHDVRVRARMEGTP